jgi:hypothetical protein
MSKRTIISTCLRCLALGSSIFACSNRQVDLGGGSFAQEVQRGSRCKASTIVAEDVSVTDQDDLEALLGCEEIHGDFTIKVFDGTDLRPLRELRAVDGVFFLGAIPGFEVTPTGRNEDELEAAQANIERAKQIVEAGWLPSLEGRESLERVGLLNLQNLSSPDLRVFESLRNVGSERLFIVGAKNLIDLRGLEHVTEFTWLSLGDNPSLESLDGLQVATVLQQIEFQHDPQLADIGALSSVEGVLGSFYLFDTGIQNLDALSHLLAAHGGVALVENAQLTQVDALDSLINVNGGLVFERNPKLERLPEFQELLLIDGFIARGNAELATLSLQFAPFGGEHLANGIHIDSNPKLETLTFEGSFAEARDVSVRGNSVLTQLDLGSLQRLDRLEIISNANLMDVSLGELQTVDSLSVRSNPRLDPSELRNVRTFESEFAGNADDPAP